MHWSHNVQVKKLKRCQDKTLAFLGKREAFCLSLLTSITRDLTKLLNLMKTEGQVVNHTFRDKFVHGIIAGVTQPPMPQPFNSGRDNNSTILINIKRKSWHTFNIKQMTSGGVTRPTCKLVNTITGGRKGPKHIRALNGSTTMTIKRNLAVKRMSHSMD
jgi:hypothetical protein